MNMIMERKEFPVTIDAQKERIWRVQLDVATEHDASIFADKFPIALKRMKELTEN